MAVNRYLSRNGGTLTDTVPATVSAGVSSAGQLIALNASGLVDSTMLPASGGSSPVGLQTPTPTIALLANAGGGTASMATGSGPFAGFINLSPTSVGAVGTIATVTTNWTTTPNAVILYPANAAAMTALNGTYALTVRQTDITSTGFSIYSVVAAFQHLSSCIFSYIAL